MALKMSKGVILAFFLCFIIVGTPYWLIPYSQVNLPDSLLNLSLLVVIVSACFLRLKFDTSFKENVFIVGSSVPAAILVRVIWEVILDPTDHNLWPFELVISAFVGFSVSLVGALLGYLLSMVFRNRGK